MTYIVLGGTLYSTYSLTHSLICVYFVLWVGHICLLPF